MTVEPIRLPDGVSVESVLNALKERSGEDGLLQALSTAFPGFEFRLSSVDLPYWRTDRRVIDADGNRLGDHKQWVEAQLAACGGDLTALWKRYWESDLQIAEWRGKPVYVSASTGPGAADFLQISLVEEIEWLAGPIVDPDFTPCSLDALLEPSWINRDARPSRPPVTGPVYRLSGNAGTAVVHMRGLLARCARIERDKREAQRSKMQARTVRIVDESSSREIPFLDANPDWFDQLPRENRFFADWEQSSAAGAAIHEHWAFDIRGFEERGEQNISFIPRPLREPTMRITADDGSSVHRLMQYFDLFDAEQSVPFSWFFFMTHGQWVDPDVGTAMATALRGNLIHLTDADAKVLLSWAERPYVF